MFSFRFIRGRQYIRPYASSQGMSYWPIRGLNSALLALRNLTTLSLPSYLITIWTKFNKWYIFRCDDQQTLVKILLQSKDWFILRFLGIVLNSSNSDEIRFSIHNFEFSFLRKSFNDLSYSVYMLTDKRKYSTALPVVLYHIYLVLVNVSL